MNIDRGPLTRAIKQLHSCFDIVAKSHFLYLQAIVRGDDNALHRMDNYRVTSSRTGFVKPKCSSKLVHLRKKYP